MHSLRTVSAQGIEDVAGNRWCLRFLGAGGEVCGSQRLRGEEARPNAASGPDSDALVDSLIFTSLKDLCLKLL